MQTLLGKKQNMTTAFNRFGFNVPVTTVIVEPNVVVSLKEDRVLVGIGKNKKIKKTEASISKAAGFTPKHLKEIKHEKIEGQEAKKFTAGDKITVSIFEPGDEVKVTGVTKGRGFAGVVKRHGFHGGPKTHGQSDRHRAPGSIGAGTTPGRVYKGKKMAGHMGAAKLTVTGLEVVEVDENKNTILIKGAIPGARNGILIIEKTGKIKGYTPPPPPNEEKQAEKAEAEAKEAKAEENQGQEEKPKEEKQENSAEEQKGVEDGK